MKIDESMHTKGFEWGLACDESTADKYLLTLTIFTIIITGPPTPHMSISQMRKLRSRGEFPIESLPGRIGAFTVAGLAADLGTGD